MPNVVKSRFLSEKTKLFLIIFITGLTLKVIAQANTDTVKLGIPITLGTKTGKIKGTILVPDISSSMPVILLISGSGPTDRDGNSPILKGKNNSLKMLAEELYKNNIASVRYDKRGIAESIDAGLEEKDLRFENYIDDAVDWVNLLKKDKRFNKIIVIGHSEGSLIGMIAAFKAGADTFISLAGAGQSADIILKEQLKTQPQFVTDLANPIIDTLLMGKMVTNVPPMLSSLFRESVQPYLISWFKYNPQTEIKKLTIPVLIVQGTTDIQISVDDAKKLSKANKNAKLAIIKGMNHILKNADAEKLKNIATYSDPTLPLSKEFVEAVIKFIKQ